MNQARKLIYSKQIIRNFSLNSIVKNEKALDEKFQLLTKERTLNLVQLIGRVGQDPKIAGQSDKPSEISENEKSAKINRVVLFSLATNEYVGADETGKSKYRTDWHRITLISHRLQEYAQKRVRQGDRVHVTGRLHYDLIKTKSGEPKLITNIVADDIIFLDKFSEP